MATHFHDELSPVMLESLEHGKRVAHLSKSLFDGLLPLHKLSKKWRTILDLGAQLHDIGWIYGKTAHHKASASMIRDAHIEKAAAIPKDIRHLVALVARYHRRADPAISQWRFAALTEKEKEAMMVLASIIRLADALDFSHTGSVKDVTVKITKNAVYLKIDPHGNCQMEIDRIATKKELFLKVFLLDVLCS